MTKTEQTRQAFDRKDLHAVWLINLGLAEKVASTFLNKARQRHVSPEDLTQEAHLALWLAVRDYKVDKGIAFSTFAMNVVKNKLINFFQPRSTKLDAFDPLCGEYVDTPNSWNTEDQETRGDVPVAELVSVCKEEFEGEEGRLLFSVACNKFFDSTTSNKQSIEALNMRLKGFSLIEIGKHLNCSHEFVRKITVETAIQLKACL